MTRAAKPNKRMHATRDTRAVIELQPAGGRVMRGVGLLILIAKRCADMKLLLTFILLVVPFQLLGVTTYFILMRSDVYRAHLGGALVPPLTFFIVFLTIFLWRYYQPGGLIPTEGALNFLVLIILAAGATLHLIGGAIAYYILYRRRG